MAELATSRRTVGTRAVSQERQESVKAGRQPKRGFGAAKQATRPSAGSTSEILFRVPENVIKVVAFVEPENYDFLYRHWIPGVTDDGRPVKIPRNCILDVSDDGCPLCDVGDEPKAVALFNVIDLDTPSKVLLWEASPEPYKRIEELYEELQAIPEDRGGPLELNSPGVYAAVSRRKKTNGYWEYTVKRVKARDLDEDYGLDPLDDDVLEAARANLHKSEDIPFNTHEELRDLAASLND